MNELAPSVIESPMKKALGGRAGSRQGAPCGSASQRESPSWSRTQRRSGSCGMAYTETPAFEVPTIFARGGRTSTATR